MNKILFALIAVIMMGLTSCENTEKRSADPFSIRNGSTRWGYAQNGCHSRSQKGAEGQNEHTGFN